ncbi:MAG: hypothetical protein NT147_01550 [Candidatus Aminicenantes bacterium]|nr:hypothetical protein [Candidatus Aminicenantes bacterium]
MGAEIQNGEILTTWKEIAAYLKTGARTCLRWEANDGLPVHRQEGASKSRVYAYKHELDAWFKARLSNGTITPADRHNGVRSKPRVLVFAPLVLLLVGGGIFLAINGAKKSPPIKVAVSGVPQSSGALDMLAGDVVESEWASAGIMRTWRKKDAAAWMDIWHIEPVRHTSLAVGNLDSGSDLELVAPGHCRETYEVEGREATRIRFFLNAYKIDFTDWWKTTYFDAAQCVLEKDNFEFTEIAVGDIDRRPGNEIVLVTAHTLSVFRYDPSLGEIRLVCTRDSFVENALPLFRSVALADIDNDGGAEILAIANEGEEGNIIENKSWLFIFEMKDDRPEISRLIPLAATTSVHSLRTGDIIPGGAKEVIFPVYRKEGEIRTTSLLGWNLADGVVFRQPLDNPGSNLRCTVFLDAGELVDTNQGEEIVVAKDNPNELIIYSWDGAQLKMGPKYSINYAARINGVQVRSLARGKKQQARILVYGSAEVENQPGHSYLELINFNDGFLPEWLRLGGEKSDLPVTYASFVFNHQE